MYALYIEGFEGPTIIFYMHGVLLYVYSGQIDQQDVIYLRICVFMYSKNPYISKSKGPK